MPADPGARTSAVDDTRAFALICAGMLLTLFAGFGFSLLLGAPIPPQASFTWSASIFGVAATLPLLGFLYWFMNSSVRAIEAFRESQIEFLSQIGFEFNLSRIILMGVGAGVTEEILFRGVFQTWLADFTPMAVAIVLPNIVFGMLHARTTLYAIIAGLVGIYLGVLFWWSGNLLVPIIAHALYDIIALEFARREISLRRAAKVEGENREGPA